MATDYSYSWFPFSMLTTSPNILIIRATPLDVSFLNILSAWVGCWDCELGAYSPNQIIYI